MVGNMNVINKIKKIKFKRIILNRVVRITIILSLLLFFFIFSYITYAAYQQPTKTVETYDLFSYGHTSNYNYDVFLENNTLYNTTHLKPGEGIIFKKLVNHINATFHYDFKISRNATINCTYKILAIIETDIWTKEYALISLKYLNTTGTKAEFTVQFPIEYDFYDQILYQINDETGIFAPNPILRIIAKISISAEEIEHPLYTYFSPSITVSLGDKAIEISDALREYQTDSILATRIIDHPEIFEQRNTSQIITIFFFLFLIASIIMTKENIVKISPLQKELRIINKKYGEWIIETSKKPVTQDMKIIPVNSIKQLSLISEEIGQPLIHYSPKKATEDNHWFFVLNNQTAFEYKLQIITKIKKMTMFTCPYCNSSYEIMKEQIAKKDTTMCPNCGNITTLYKSDRKTAIFNIFKQLKKV